MTTQNQLLAIGYWHNDDDGQLLPHPSSLVDAGWRVREKGMIVDYLRAGIRIRESLGYSPCRFPGGPKDEEMGNSDMSDGVWCWPEGLWVYVERFNVRLPEEFVDHLLVVGPAIFRGLNQEDLESRSVDAFFWLEWSRQQGQCRTDTRTTSLI